MRILSLAPTSFFGDYGCHVRILEEAHALKALGHDVTILAYHKGNSVPDVPGVAGIRVLRTAPTPWHKTYEVGSSRHKFAFDALLSLSLLRLLARERFDVVHAHLHEGALIAGVLARFFKTPVCFDYQGSLTDEMKQHGFIRHEALLRLFGRVEAAAERLPSAIFTSTKHAADSLHRTFGDSKLIQHLPDGVNTDAFHPNVLSPETRIAQRAAWGIGADEPVVAFLGLLAVHQGIDNIIQAALAVRQGGQRVRGQRVRWLVMGYPSVELWRKKALQAGLTDEIVFTGRVPYERAPHMLALGDMAVAPKLSLTEGSGKLLNYMAMGLPTVAFDTPAQREYLGHLGIYVPMGDSSALAREVLALLNQPERRGVLAEKLRLRARQHFGWDRGGVLMESIYTQLVAGQPRDVRVPAEVGRKKL